MDKIQTIRAYLRLFRALVITALLIPLLNFELQAKSKPVLVKVQTLKSQSIPQIVTYVGRIVPDRELSITSKLQGTITQISVTAGESVKSGQLLAQIDSTDYQLSLDDAKAKLASVEARLISLNKKFMRAEILLKKKILPQEKYDDIDGQVKAAQAQLTRARIAVKMAVQRLEKTKIRAPISGQIADRRLEMGQWVRTGEILIHMVDLSRVRVKVQMVEGDYVHVDKQDKVVVQIEAFDNRTFKGRIDKIGIVADPKTATFPVEIVIDNKDLTLKAGFSAKVAITIRILKDIFFIPNQAILYGSDGTYVYVALPNRTVQKRKVNLGQSRDQLRLVLKGLQNSDRLIIQGQNALKPGDSVIIK